jgi:hypothetical protein
LEAISVQGGFQITKAMHVNIVVSGFLSKKDDADKVWKGLLASDESQAYYNLRWNASCLEDVVRYFGEALLN